MGILKKEHRGLSVNLLLFLQVVFVKGIAHGPARRFSARGQLTWVGRYRHGSPYGLCWKSGDGRGWSCGLTDSIGRISDPNAIYLYPNLHSGLQGEWCEDRMKVRVRGEIYQRLKFDNHSL